MEIKTYEDEDLQEVSVESELATKSGFKFMFVADLPGDNPDLFPDLDNKMLTERLKEKGVIDAQMSADPEDCVFYIYFAHREHGRRFISAINHYLLAKAEKLSEAQGF